METGKDSLNRFYRVIEQTDFRGKCVSPQDAIQFI